MNNVNKKYRHELKFLTQERILFYLEQKTNHLLKKDTHVGEKGFYNIRSLYFDDMYNSCYFENENGTDPREKFRIRIYNGDSSRIQLELKQKQNSKCYKSSTPISYERCVRLLEGKSLDVNDNDTYLYKKFYLQTKLRNLKPAVIVDYNRVPYIWNQGNVRITFDRDIKSSFDYHNFFKKSVIGRPILRSYANLLEVKFDEFLPDFIYEILQTGELTQTAFSKYYLCRKYNPKGLQIK